MAGAMNFYAKLCWRIDRAIGRLRVWHFRLKGIRIATDVYIDRGVQIVGDVEIGPGTNIGSYSYIGSSHGGRVVIGADCHIGKLNQIGSSGARVTIDAHCIFAAYVQITDATHGFKQADLRIKTAPVSAEAVHLHENVWLGSAAMVTMGVNIGAGAVIGAKSLVRENVPANAIVVGTPSRVVGYREHGANCLHPAT